MAQVSLVLGAGGARGYAHIGAIAELEARGHEIVCVAGSSMGALVGGLYVAGGLEGYRRWVETLRWIDVVRLLDLSFRNGTFRGEKIFARLRDLIGDPDIESLPIPYTAVATDLRANKEVWFQRGSLLTAIRASIAIPGIVTPVIDGRRLLVDGGVLNPLPIVPTVAASADLIIAVDVNSPREMVAPFLDSDEFRASATGHPMESIGRLGLLLASMEVMQSALTKYKVAGYGPDLVIRVPKEIGGFHEYHRARELIAAGQELARRQLDAFERIRAQQHKGSADE
jgi:NTE family protein